MKNSISTTKNTFVKISKSVLKKSNSVLLAIAFTCAIANSAFASGGLTVTLTPSNVNCQGLKNGQVTANVSGGTPPYIYSWSNDATTQSISGLNAEYYHCYVRDQNGAFGEAGINLTEPEKFSLMQFDVHNYPNGANTSCYICNDGIITVVIAGGTPPYTYLWNDGATTSNRTNLAAGDYQLVVTDAFGCQLREMNVSISKPEKSVWNMAGNTGTNPTTHFIGTLDAQPLLFKTSGQ